MNPLASAAAMPVVPQGLILGVPQVAQHGVLHGSAPVVIPQAPVGAEVTGPPNNTVYINNLNEKIKRDELKKSLYAVFVQFGQILDIITSKTHKMRGQAFVVFDDVNSAATALRAMRGFPLYEKPMRIQFAKIDSDVVAKRKGTYVPRPKVVNKAAAAAAAAEAAAAAAAFDAVGPQGGTSARAIRRRQQRAAAAAAAAAAEAAGAGGVAIPPPESGLGDTHNQAAPPPPPPPPINPATIPDQPPNKILFLTNLPEDANEAMISMLFNQFTGYREVRMVPGRSDIAFVEFDSEVEASAAKHGLQGFTIRPGVPIRITFAKK
ncbi:Small nuclear ribonucleoprotein polypeptide A [Fasciola gigantica]|uniref:Small nuclear ribonucleoprotein polypeptide A n=1 Tax=Fasciola gigantica TaxID=46835 RepID=A0A504YNG4_FASGI|nr:Small nuclear ribonucleoprotein polypeptide A [Fasciola gigantica]